MTANQVAALNYQETKRANEAREGENIRSNLAREAETKRADIAKEAENYRSNVTRERETERSNRMGEKLGIAKLPADYISATGNFMKGAGSLAKVLI